MQLAAQQLETQAVTLAGQAAELTIVDQQTYEIATERLLGVVDLRREITEHHAPIKRSAHAAWQAVCSAEKRLLGPVESAERIIKSKIGEYTEQQRRLEAEAQRQAEAESLRLAELAREAELEQAEAEGATDEEVAAMAAAPLPLLPLRAPQTHFQAVRGISTAEQWKAAVESLESLVKAIAAGQASITLVKPDDVAIGALARATRGTLAVPGVRFYAVNQVRAGRK